MERLDQPTAKTSYVSDPANPVPYRHRPIQPTYSEGSQWYNWLTEDQRFVTDRNDVAVWKLPVLKKDLTLTGEVVADIFASTTGTDNDLVVKLIDQYPDDDPDPKMRGYQLMTNAEIFRGRYLDPASTTPRRCAPAPSTSTSSRSTTWTTSSKPATPSWSRFRAPGSRSTTATRRPSCPTS